MRVIAADRLPFDGRFGCHVMSQPCVVDAHETGDLKLLMVDGTAASRRTAALRLRDSEEDGCLWRLRSSDDGLRTRIKRVLVET
jgi:hypothetical protein